VRSLVLAVLVALAACSTGPKHDDGTPPPPPDRTMPTTPDPRAPIVYLGTSKGEVKVTVEVVATEPKIERGLMYREHLPPDDGMLFMMGREYDWKFYMRNTLIPLDMIFISRDQTIAGIVANATPRTEDLRSVGKPSLYVLEVNGGWAVAHGVYAGAKVRFENVDLAVRP
jgi:uncharacterized protein